MGDAMTRTRRAVPSSFQPSARCIKRQWPTSRSSSMPPGAAPPASRSWPGWWASPPWSSWWALPPAWRWRRPSPAWTCPAGARHTPANLVKRAQKPGLLARAERLAAAAQKRRLDEIASLRQAQSALPSRALPAILKPQDGPAAGDRLLYQLAGQGRSGLAVAETLAEESGLGGAGLDDPGRAGPEPAAPGSTGAALDFIRANKPGVAILPMVQNVTGRQMGRRGTGQAAGRSAALATSCWTRSCAFVAANKLQGVTIDFEEVPKSRAQGSGGFSVAHVGGLCAA